MPPKIQTSVLICFLGLGVGHLKHSLVFMWVLKRRYYQTHVVLKAQHSVWMMALVPAPCNWVPQEQQKCKVRKTNIHRDLNSEVVFYEHYSWNLISRC